VISPLLSNIYLNKVDKMLERAKEVTQDKYTHLEYARFADDLVVLVDEYERHDWIVKAANKRLREEFTKLQIQVNEEKTRQVDLRRDESFGFLGFEFRRVRSLKGALRPQYTPLLKKRTELLCKLKEEFRRLKSQPTEKVIELINPILRGWVNYFAWGDSSTCFNYVRNWVEKKVRRHLMRSRQRKGSGWKRWSNQLIYEELGLFDDYHVRRPKPSLAKATSARYAT
jgi:RNA-directed DNA polymerase